MQIIYADVLFVINFAANMLALLATSKICSSPVRMWRAVCSAALGGAYSIAAMLPPLAFMAYPAVKVAAGVMMALIVFGGQKGLARKTVVFFAVAAAFGGVAYAASAYGGGAFSSLGMPALMLILAASWICVSHVFRRAGRASGIIAELTVRYAGREVRLPAMTDTGNSLTDPLTGYPAAVVGLSDADRLFPREVRKRLEGLRTATTSEIMEELGSAGMAERFRLIPYSTVGVKGGMLLAFRPDEVLIDGKRKSGMVIALSPNSVSDGGPYSALIGTGA